MNPPPYSRSVVWITLAIIAALTVGWLAGTHAVGRDLTCVTLDSNGQIYVACHRGQSNGSGA